MRDKIDFKKILYQGELIGVLNFNLMIPVEDALIQKIDTKIRKHDNADTRKKKESQPYGLTTGSAGGLTKPLRGIFRFLL